MQESFAQTKHLSAMQDDPDPSAVVGTRREQPTFRKPTSRPARLCVVYIEEMQKRSHASKTLSVSGSQDIVDKSSTSLAHFRGSFGKSVGFPFA